MKVAFDALEQVDRLTCKDLPLLDDDEWIEIRRYRDYTRDTSAETKSLVRVTDEEIEDRTPREDDDADDEQSPEQGGGFRIDQGRFLIHQFEYMCLDWNLYEPADANGTRRPIRFTKENRLKFVRLAGVHLMGQMLIRGGGIAPDLSSKVDPDTGKPFLDEESAAKPARRRVGKSDLATPDPA